MTKVKRKLSEFGFVKRFLLKTIHKMQKNIVREWDNQALYFLLSRIHFRLWFGLSLYEEVRKGSSLAMRAAKRHSKIIFKEAFQASRPDLLQMFPDHDRLKSDIALTFITLMKQKANEKQIKEYKKTIKL